MRRLGLLLLFATTSVHAKEVSIRWVPLRKAVRYELRIEHEGEVEREVKVQTTHWKGEVEYGLYVYRVRAIDRVGRPGKWSSVKPLAAMPEAPELISPSEEKLVRYDPRAQISYRWKAVKGVHRYFVEVLRGRAVVASAEADGTSATLEGLPSGNYRWRVAPVMDASGRVPANFQGRRWRGTSGDEEEFKVEVRALRAPSGLSPVGETGLPGSHRLRLSWRAVEGAAEYELRLAPVRDTGAIGDLRYQPTGRTEVIKTTDPSATLPWIKLGQYVWEVRAIASAVAPELPALSGPKTAATLDLHPAAEDKSGSGFVAISGMFAPYNYRIATPLQAAPREASSFGLTGRLSAEQWLSSRIAVAGGVDAAFFMINYRELVRMNYELWTKYQLSFEAGGLLWFLHPKLGGELRNYPDMNFGQDAAGFITPGDPLMHGVLGADAGLDLRAQFAESFSLGIRTAYFYPLKLLDQPTGSTITSAASYRNFNVGAQALYWLSPSWAAAVGGYVDFRSISYRTIRGGDPNWEDRIYLDGSFLYLSLLWSWGR